MQEAHPASLSPQRLDLTPIAGRLVPVGAALAALGLGGTALLAASGHDGGKQFFHSYLLALAYFTSLSLGALFFVTLQHLTRAGWSVGIRRLAELIATNLPLLVLLFVPLLVPMLRGNAALYPWVDAALVQHDATLRAKAPYLNTSFFAVRCALYFTVWAVLSRYYLRQSLAQDHSGDARLTLQMQRVAAPGMFLFALTLTFCAFDWLMSLEPHWFSTMFGVYFFAGSVISFLATTIVISRLLSAPGRPLAGVLTTEHFHDIGKLLFGFTFFWGYVGFSQYMLYWYANIPEETEWFLERQTGEWTWLSLSLLFGHFLLPFPGLLSRHVKRSRVGLAFWAVFMLVMHWVDLYWLVMPSLREGALPLSLLDLTSFVGVGGACLTNFGLMARGKAAVPMRDPRLAESLAFENV